MKLRFARWAAVSTKEQAADDKFSIPTQLERTFELGKSKGWVETAGPFVVAGQSRTKYLTLESAVRAIPALRDMLDAARNHKFDVLVMTEFDRLRELLDPVFRTLAAYHVQLYSIAQAIEPVSPDDYDQYSSDSVALTIGLSTIISRADISRMRRKWREQMPKRITERGLPATGISWGYRKPRGQEESRKAIPEQNPEITRHILKMRDMLLDGQSIRQIIAYLKSNKIPAPHGGEWYPQTVRDILRNPFYAGWVVWGKSRVFLDPYGRKRRNRRLPDSEIICARGKHKPLWDDATRDLLVAELRRRRKSYRGRKNNQFTGLVKCQCGASMWRQENGPRADRFIWRCSKDKTHPPILHSRLLQLVGDGLIPALEPLLKKRRAVHRTELHSSDDDAARAEIEKQLERLEEAYLSGKFDLSRYGLHKSRLDARLAELDDKRILAAHARAERETWLANMQSITSLHHLPEWLREEDPQKVNRRLHLLIEKIIVTGNKIKIVFRP